MDTSLIQRISRALNYSTTDRMLANGASIDDVLAYARNQAQSLPVGDEAAPESMRTIFAEV